jgi:hypothetical protein
MQKLTLTITIFLMLSVAFFSNCKSNQASETAKQDSLKTAASSTVSAVVNKYLIAPPDSDYTGDYVDKYPNGIVKFSGFYRFGQRHGQWMAFYENGNMWSECYYDKGKKHGASNVYYLNGKPQYKGWFKNDLRDSLWLFFDTLGKQVDKRAFSKDIETGLVN